jgi:hypothetical protein
VTDNNNKVSFKIKRTTALGKRINTFCDRQGKNISSERFPFNSQRVILKTVHAGAQSEHFNNDEVSSKIKRTTALGKLMDAFCHR